MSSGAPLGAAQGLAPHNTHLPAHFLSSVLDGSSLADVSMLAFRDPDSYVAGNLHAYHAFWQYISRSAPCDLANVVLNESRILLTFTTSSNRLKDSLKGHCHQFHFESSRA